MKFRRTIAAAILGVIVSLPFIGVGVIPFVAKAQVPVGNMREYPVSFTPVATAAAIGTTEQALTATGVALDDVVYVNAPSITALCPLVGARVSAASTVQLQFATMTAAACTPAAGVYRVVAVR